MDRENLFQKKDTYLFSKVESTQVDEVIVNEVKNDYYPYMDKVMEFTVKILEEREKLARAIATTKANLQSDIDTDLMLNKERRDMANLFRTLSEYKDAKTVLKNTGTGYRFDINNEQKPFRCDVETVQTVNFDTSKAKAYCRDLTESAERVSNALDETILMSLVEYESPFDLLENFASNFRTFAEAK